MPPTEAIAGRLRVLHVTPFYEPARAYGGMVRAVAGLCAALARRGLEVTVATARLDAAHPEQETRDGVRVLRLPVPPLSARLLVPWSPGLARTLERFGFDLAHLHGHRSGLSLSAAAAMRRRGIPWVLQPHGTYPHHGRHRVAKALLDVWRGRGAVRGAAALIAVSRAEERELPRPARLLPNGVDAEGDGPGVSAEPGRLLFVGTDHPQKRGLRLAGLLEDVSDARLWLVGRFGEGFRRAFRRFGARVEHLGVLEGAALERAYRAASVIVHPAAGEAFGLVPFEAALRGRPSVVAGDHGCGEWFGHAGGCVVPVDDRSALAAAVAERLRDQGLGSREAAAVAAFCRRELSWERTAASAEALYREVLAGAAA